MVAAPNGTREGRASNPESAMPDRANPILLFDGVCGLCHRLVQFVLKRDPTARFRFASLQSDYATRILQRHGLDPQDLDTVYVVESPGDRPKARSAAVIFILRELGGLWSAVSTALRILPRPLRDWGYNVVARHRYRVFGKYKTCPLPGKKYRERFLDT
jgi:predicted DCC family thiol-disulfide oxidoreductase YuxK